ncbi:MAG TPA: SDR family NAD(P)-dependent oxidoreductase [Acidothermaceae bacterium]
MTNNGTRRPQRVVLLGGASEIGLALVSALDLPPGAAVVLAGRSDERLAAAAASLPSNLDARRVWFDASTPEKHGAFFDELFTDQVDVLIAAFGVLPRQTEAEQEPMRAVDSLAVNLSGQVSALLHAANHMRRQGHGDLVVFSSIAAVRGRRANYVYGAAKAGLDAFACGLADALRGSGVHVLVVRPGFVRGRMTQGMKAAPFSTTSAKVAAATATALRGRRAVVWAPSSLRFVAFAMRLTPRGVWRRLRF